MVNSQWLCYIQLLKSILGCLIYDFYIVHCFLLVHQFHWRYMQCCRINNTLLYFIKQYILLQSFNTFFYLSINSIKFLAEEENQSNGIYWQMKRKRWKIGEKRLYICNARGIGSLLLINKHIMKKAMSRLKGVPIWKYTTIWKYCRLRRWKNGSLSGFLEMK